MSVDVMRRVREVLARITPTLPLELDDSVAVRKLVGDVLPPGFGVEVYHDHKKLYVRVSDRGTIILSQQLEVK